MQLKICYIQIIAIVVVVAVAAFAVISDYIKFITRGFKSSYHHPLCNYFKHSWYVYDLSLRQIPYS
jgi:hypothetical protein